jgi:prepilin peptidase CpaA
MPFLSVGKLIVADLLTAILVWAAISDVRSRRIPNWTVIAVLVLFVPWALLHWGAWSAWALAGGLIALLIGFGLYAANVIGAGDAKLFAAVALFAGLGHLLAFAVATALAGGAMALISLAARPRRAYTMLMLRGKGDFGPGLPYGVAISAGGCIVVWGVLLNLSMIHDFGH